MLLHSLLSQFDSRADLNHIPRGLQVTGVTDDSRRVQPGNLFIARAGTTSDGSRFAADAVAKGAVAIVTEKRVDSIDVPQFIVPSAAIAGPTLAHLFHRMPSKAMRILAVTGTNGKTTTAYLVRHLLGHAKQRCGLIGTVEIDDGLSRYESDMTTPSGCELAGILAKMRDNGCRAVVMETSSHALDQHRLAGIDFTAGAFTNLTGDHLDYHKTMDSYAGAKAKLFESLDSQAVAIVNDEEQWSERMLRDCKSKQIRFGFGKNADYRARDIAITPTGTHFILQTPDGRTEVAMKLIGKHNIENALAAAALVGESFGLSVQQIARGLSDAPPAPGRLQPVIAGQPFAVLVDYAHTDDALENVLSALRPLTKGRLRVLFGCGGDRDRTKRPRMARIAERLADEIYITSDNPRTEDPHAILDEIVTGLSDDPEKLACVEVDRRVAIRKILADAAAGDVVLIAGKGHENYQIIGKEKRHFDDVEEATRVLCRGPIAA